MLLAEFSPEEQTALHGIETKVVKLGLEKNCLQNLPAEIRNTIYNLVLDTDKKFGIKAFPWTVLRCDKDVLPHLEPPLLQTSQRIRQEASMIYYGANTFEVALPSAQISRFCDWVSTIAELCGRNPFTSIRLHLSSGEWKDVRGCFPLAELFYQVEWPMAQDGNDLPPNSTAIEVVGGSGHRIRQVLEEAISLGLRARMEGWQHQELKVGFLDMVLDLAITSLHFHDRERYATSSMHYRQSMHESLPTARTEAWWQQGAHVHSPIKLRKLKQGKRRVAGVEEDQ